MQRKGCAEADAGCRMGGGPRRAAPAIRRGHEPAADLHSAGCRCGQAGAPGKYMAACPSGLLSRGRGVRAVDHSRLLPQKSEAISQISRTASGLIERPAPLTFPSSFPLRIWNRDKKRTYFSGYQYLLLAKPQRRRYSKNRVRETQRSSQP